MPLSPKSSDGGHNTRPLPNLPTYTYSKRSILYSTWKSRQFFPCHIFLIRAEEEEEESGGHPETPPVLLLRRLPFISPGGAAEDCHTFFLGVEKMRFSSSSPWRQISNGLGMWNDPEKTKSSSKDKIPPVLMRCDPLRVYPRASPPVTSNSRGARGGGGGWRRRKRSNNSNSIQLGPPLLSFILFYYTTKGGDSCGVLYVFPKKGERTFSFSCACDSECYARLPHKLEHNFGSKGASVSTSSSIFNIYLYYSLVHIWGLLYYYCI